MFSSRSTFDVHLSRFFTLNWNIFSSHFSNHPNQHQFLSISILQYYTVRSSMKSKIDVFQLFTFGLALRFENAPWTLQARNIFRRFLSWKCILLQCSIKSILNNANNFSHLINVSLWNFLLVHFVIMLDLFSFQVVWPVCLIFLIPNSGALFSLCLHNFFRITYFNNVDELWPFEVILFIYWQGTVLFPDFSVIENASQ